MKNVSGWKTGTYYGEPVYKTVGEEKLVDPGLNEYYVHADPKALYNRAYWHKYLWICKFYIKLHKYFTN